MPPPRRIAGPVVEYLGLAVMVGGAFVLVVFGVEAWVGAPHAHPALLLASVLLVGVGFEPVRSRWRRLANRLVYGHRRSPWEAVAGLSAEMGRGLDPLALLKETTATVVAGTGARSAVVWLRTGSSWQAVVGTPEVVDAAPIRGRPGTVPELGTDLTVPIHRGRELLGALAVDRPGGLSTVERRLVEDIAAHAGIVTSELRLRRRLERQVALARRRHGDLVASRERLVAAHDDERRRLERDIHDRCQPSAVALAARLGLVQVLAQTDVGQARALAAEAATDLSRLRTALDGLVQALPPLELVSHGLGPALRSETATSPVPVDVHDGLSGRRYRADLEDAVFHCCLEAVQNAVKHADASLISVRLSESDAGVAATVEDDGVGFDPDHASAGAGLRNMRDRVAAAGGALSIRSGPEGTTVVAAVPAGPA